jgi:hypothetical protein
MPLKYHDFSLTVQGSSGQYTVSARAPGDLSVQDELFDYNPSSDLEYELSRIRSGDSPTKERMQEIGGFLFNALFTRRIARLFGRAYDPIPAGESLRLKLSLQPAELSALPWELLFDSDESVFLAARLSYPVVRHIESGIPVAAPVTAKTLKVLYLQASPVDLPPLDLEKSEQALRQAFGSRAEITPIRSATPEMLQRMLRQDFHILHYDGHAFFDEEQKAGAICLQDEQGGTHQVSGETLAAFLDNTSVRLVVLAACQSGMDSPQKRFSGIAQQLMKTSSLPAAIAMQFSVRDDAAIAFNRGFYEALADRYPVEAAVVEGRKAILQVLGNDPFAAPDWATPVLYLRAQDGALFPQPKAEKEPKPMSEKTPRSGGIKIGSINASGNSNINIAEGDINQTSATTNITQNATPVDFTNLLAEIKKLIESAGLDSDITDLAKADLGTVESLSRKDKPSPALITAKLKGLTDVVGAAAGAAAAVQKLAPLIEQAVKMAQQLFH